MNTARKDNKSFDIIIIIFLSLIVITMIIFTVTRQTANKQIILMEIYKCAGPETSSASMSHYYIYANTNTIEIRNANSDGSNAKFSKEIEQNLIDNFRSALDKYISENPTLNNNFYINERYTIEYNGKSIIVPNPSVANLLGYDQAQYTFYNTVEDFINNINN